MKRVLAYAFVIFSIGLVATGCGKKDETVDKAPPPGDNAKPDPANPDKVKNLPPALSPTGGGK